MSFDQLDRRWRQTDMLAEWVHDEPGDGMLNADELWTTHCDLARDIMGIADIDPHVMLMIFLPPLLFESACFGIGAHTPNRAAYTSHVVRRPQPAAAALAQCACTMPACPRWCAPEQRVCTLR
jgi:hypothetical protein